MQEITKLQMTREQLKGSHIYYNGCTTSDCAIDDDKCNVMIDCAAAILIDILVNYNHVNV